LEAAYVALVTEEQDVPEVILVPAGATYGGTYATGSLRLRAYLTQGVHATLFSIGVALCVEVVMIPLALVGAAPF
jgi:hypothetical protein